MKDGSSILEQRLQSLFLGENEEDRREFVVLAGPVVYSYFVRLGVPDSDRDDLFQEVLLRLIQSKEQYDRERRFIPWLLTIAVNLSRSHFRKIRRLNEFMNEIPAPCLEIPDALEAFTGKETAKWVEAQLLKLPVAQREAVILCCFEHMEQQDAASILEIPEATLRTNLRRGRLALAKALVCRSATERSESMA